jgi:hypothetical protein
MLKALGLAAVALTLALPAAADHMKHRKGYGSAAPMKYAYNRGGGTITVSCFRGPWKEVIWDRPNAVFVDSLVNVGYTYERAHAIAERVCRDEALVGNPGAMRETMRRIYNGASRY